MTASELRDIAHQVKSEARQRAARAFARGSRSSGDHGVLVGDLGLLHDRLKDDSVDLLLTDPPYARIDLYERLGELAAAKLKPGGLCLAYTGQIHLPEVMAAMGRHLTYWWMFAIQFAGQHCAIHPRRIQNVWKPILAFAKPPIGKAPEWLSDLLQGGGRDKRHHDWGQGESEAEYLIRHLTEPGQLVVDPFCGGGSVVVACKALGRRWLACEIDQNTALVARKRVGESQD
jgi:site-specific DNA-methyltransferase (adenine-specific)